MPEIVVAPRFRGFICTAAHPDGCAANVQQQITTIAAACLAAASSAFWCLVRRLVTV